MYLPLKHYILLLAAFTARRCLAIPDDQGSQQPKNCAYVFSITDPQALPSEGDCSQTVGATSVTGANSSVLPLMWRCASLQSALTAIPVIAGEITNLASLYEEESSANFSDCVTVNIPSGQHVIGTPVYFGNISVQIIGTAQNVMLTCDYTIEVNLDRLFDPTYFYVNSTMYFDRSEYFMMQEVSMFGCGFPLRLDRVGRVVIQHSSFQ